MSLKLKKKESLFITKKVFISKSLFEYFQKIGLNQKYVQLESFKIKDIFFDSGLKYQRFFQDNSSCEMVLNTLRIKISKKKRQEYFENIKNKLIKSYTNEKYLFVIKYMKTEKTSFKNAVLFVAN